MKPEFSPEQQPQTETDEKTVRELEELLSHDIGILTEEERKELQQQIQENPESAGLNTTGMTLPLPGDLIEEFREDRQRVVEEMMANAQNRAEQFIEENFPAADNKEKAIDYLAKLEAQLIQDNSHDFVDGKTDTLDLTHITIIVKAAEYKNADGQQVETVISFEITGQTDRPSEITDQGQREDMEAAKERGEYNEETK
jgi:hypothetical protein